MGNKEGIYFPKYAQKLERGSLVLLRLKNDLEEVKFISRFNYNIIIRKEFARSLNFAIGELIDVKITKIGNTKRAKNLFCNNKVDLLHLIPGKTSEGYEIIVNEFSKNGEKWLRLWYCHDRGSGRQREIRRLVDIKKFGSLLGQYQAEGTKHKKGKKFRVEFTNKLVQEHCDFLDSMNELGLEKKDFVARINYNGYTNKEKIRELIKEFEEKIGLCVVESIGRKTKGIGFKTVYINTLITEIILHAMNQIRKKFSNNKPASEEEIVLVGAFFSKLMTGDGNMDIRKRWVNNIQAQIKITDGDTEYLTDYKAIMKNLDFSAYIITNNVKAYCTEKLLFYLYKIRAFENTTNWYKLLIAIELYSRRHKSKITLFDEIENMKRKEKIVDSLELLDRLKVKPNKRRVYYEALTSTKQ